MLQSIHGVYALLLYGRGCWCPGSIFPGILYISATQSHDKSKAIRYKNHPSQTLYFTGFSDGQKYSQRVSKKVNVYKGLRTMRHEILCNFCYLFNNLILHNPFKNKDLYDTMVDTLKHLQVHAIPYKYCYCNASKCDYIVTFLTIYILKGEGVLFTSHKNTTTAPRGGYL